MGTIVRLPLLQATVPLSQRNFQRVSELGKLRDLEVKLTDLPVRKLRYLPAGRTACVSDAQYFYEFF
jgi:hypothetical protein